MRNMRKGFAALLILAFLIVLIPNSASATAFSYTLDSPEIVDPGETFDVTATVTANPGVVSLRFTVSYSPALTLVSVTNGGIMGDILWSDDNTVGVSDRRSGVCSLVWNNPTAASNYTSTGTLVTLRFTVSSSAQPGSLSVSFTGEEAWDKDLNAVAVSDAATYSQIMPSGDVYYLFVSEDAESDPDRDGTLEHPFYYLSEAISKLNSDGAAPVAGRPIEILLIGRVYDNEERTNLQNIGGNVPTVSFGGSNPQITVKSLSTDPDAFATLVHNYTNTGSLIGVNNFFKFENINFTAAGSGSGIYVNGFPFIIGENCSFTTKTGGKMSIYGGGASKGATYSGSDIQVYSGSWATVSGPTSWRGTVTGDFSVVIGGSADVTNLYTGMSSAGSSTAGDTGLSSTGSTAFNSTVVVQGSARVTNFYNGSSFAVTYTANSDLNAVVAENAVIGNLYTLGNSGTLNGTSVVRINGGSVANLVIGFKTPASASCDDVSRVIFTAGTTSSVTVQDGMTGLYSVEAELTEPATAVVVPQLDFDRVSGSVGRLLLGDPAWTVFPVYSFGSLADRPRIQFNTEPELDQVLAVLYEGAPDNAARFSTSSGAASIQNSMSGYDVPVVIASGLGVKGNTLILENDFSIRYLFDKSSVDKYKLKLGVDFTASYSLDGGSTYTDAVIKKITLSGNAYYSFVVTGISAKAIGDPILVVNSLSSSEDEYSIREVCLSVVNAPSAYDAEFVTLAKALLNYGRAAQLNFEYNLDKPILTSYYEGIVAKEFTDQSSVGSRKDKDVRVMGTSLLLKNYVSLKFYIGLKPNVDPEGLTAHLAYGSRSVTSPLVQSGDYYTVSIELPAKDLRVLASVWVTDESGSIVSNRYTDSVASYCAYRINTQGVTGTDREIVEKLMAFVDSAKAYLDLKYPYVLDEDNLNPIFH